MNLSDPFNRLSGRKQKEYIAFQQQLQQLGIDTEGKALALLMRSRNRILSHCLIVLVVCIVLVMVSPKLVGIVVVFGSLILLWLVMTMLRGQRMLRQFIQQEFSAESGD